MKLLIAKAENLAIFNYLKPNKTWTTTRHSFPNYFNAVSLDPKIKLEIEALNIRYFVKTVSEIVEFRSKWFDSAVWDRDGKLIVVMNKEISEFKAKTMNEFITVMKNLRSKGE